MTITAKRRKQRKLDCYIYYNDWTGEIISVGTSPRNDSLAPYIVTEDSNAYKILAGEINDQNFVISSDRYGKEQLVRKSQYLELRKKEDVLFLLPEAVVDEWDIRVRLYIKNKRLVVQANQNKIKKLVAHNIKNNIKLKAQAMFEFYLVRRDNPDYLVETIKVDAESLINYGRVVVDIRHVLTQVALDDISILTRRYFETYYFETINDIYVDTSEEDKSEHTFIWRQQDKPGPAHIRFTQTGDIVKVSSLVKSEQLDDIGINQMMMSFFVIDGSPDRYLGEFAVDMSRVRMGQHEKFEVDFDLEEVDLLYQNSRLKIDKRKVNDNRSDQ